MCKCLTRDQIKKAGMLSLSFVLAMSIICIFVQGFDYQQLDMRWAIFGEWRFTAIFQVSSIVIVVGFTLFGGMVLLCVDSKPLQLIYFILGLLSAMYSFCICVFTLTAGAIGKTELALSCNKDYNGIFSSFRYLDAYFQLVDQKLCSEACRCYFSNKTAVDDFNKANYAISVIDNVVTGSVNFAQCSAALRKEVIDKFIASSTEANDLIGRMKQDQFDVYWKRIEKMFECTGWCQTTYTNADGNPVQLKKYLFSDVNGGIVNNLGCMKRMIDWLPKMLNTYGSVLLIISVAQVVSIVFVMSLFCDCGLEDSHKGIVERQEDNLPIKSKNNFDDNDNRDNRHSEMQII